MCNGAAPCNQPYGIDIVDAIANKLNCAAAQAKMVAQVAGIANLNIRRKALLEIHARASSNFPARDNFSGFMEHT
jgi:hypothetical protein